MNLRQFHLRVIKYATTLAILVSPLGCGEDPSVYQNEALTYENPVSSKRVINDKAVTDLDLSEEQKSDFGALRIAPFALYPWGPYPYWDYYLDPVPYGVPVGPGLAVLDYVHPFYEFAAWSPFWGDDDGHSHHGHHGDDDEF